MSLSSFAALSALVLAAGAQPIDRRAGPPAPDREFISGLSVRWQAALAGAFREFSRERNPQPRCFSIYAYVRGESLLVNFTPGRPLPQDTHLRGGSTSCGRYVSFLMSRDGTLLRRTYAR